MNSDSNSLSGRIVLITGAAQGLGLATAAAYARCGAKLALVDLNKESLNASVAVLQQNGAECIAIVADIAASGAPHLIVQQVTQHFGRLDILINNAGVSSVEALLDVTE